MSLASFSRGIAPASRIGAGAGVFGLAGASLFAATPAFAAEFECSTIDGLPTPTLVADGVCEIIITRDDTDGGAATFTFPASMGKIQAVIVGAGGGGASFEPVNYDYMAYGGGGGQVAFVDEVALDTPIDVIIGAGGDSDYNDDASSGGASIFDNSSLDPVIAAGGYGATEYGGGHLALYDNINGGLDYLNYGDWWTSYLDGAEYYALGGGAGAAGSASGVTPGPGFVLSDLVAEFGAAADLFPVEADSIEYGMGGEGTLEEGSPIILIADQPVVASGHGGNATQYYYDPSSDPGDAYFVGSGETDGADGAIILRYGAEELAEELAATGVDATATLAAGAVAAAAGAGLVAMTARRRRISA